MEDTLLRILLQEGINDFFKKYLENEPRIYKAYFITIATRNLHESVINLHETSL